MVLKDEVVVKVDNRLKALYGADAPASIVVLDLVEEVEEAIRNYCNISAVPRGLLFVWVNLAVDLGRYHAGLKRSIATSTGGAGARQPALAGVVTGLTEGDTSLSLAVDAESESVNVASAHTLAEGVDGLLLDYRNQLNKYRRILW